MFLLEFSDFLERYSPFHDTVLINGDFNIHVDNIYDNHATQFVSLFECMNLKQLVKEPTHRHGHTLDLLIVPSTASFINDVHVFDPQLSDHCVISCTIHFNKPQHHKSLMRFRNFRDIDFESFKNDIKQSALNTVDSCMDVNALVMHYNNTLKNILDQHAPLKVKQSVRQNGQPWFNGLVNATRKERRKLERKWRQSKLEIDRQKYKIKSKELERLIVNEKKKFYIRNIEDNKNNQKNLFKTFGKLLNNSVVFCFT